MKKKARDDMKGIFIPEITTEMFRNGCLESIETLMAEGEIYDIEYPLEQEPKIGHWCRGEKDKYGYYHFHCSECNEEIQTKNKDFCDPHCCMCGAKMESEE